MQLYLRRVSAFGIALAFMAPLLGTSNAWAYNARAPEKPATAATRAANLAVLRQLPFSDRADFEDATRGLIESPQTLSIMSEARGQMAWDIEGFRKFIDVNKPAPHKP